MSHLNDKVVAIPPFRPSPDILQNHRKRWHSLLTTRLLIVFKALKRQFRTISPNGSLETWMYMGIFSWMVAKLRQHWYTIDPVANVASRLYYEFQLGETSNEHSWITHWINNRPSTATERRCVRVSTGNKNVLASTGLPNEDSEVRAIRKDLGYKGLPYFGKTQWFWYRGGLFRAQKLALNENGQLSASEDDDGDYYIRLFAKNRAPFLYLLAEAKKKYEANNPQTIDVAHFTGRGWSNWRARQKRDLDDIIITEQNRAKLQHTVEDFLKSGRWYLNRGLSWKKGLLLYGPPGCGKTSCIIGLASKYDLNVHYLSLNHPGLDDETLASAVRFVPQRTIICLEDCDIWARNHNRRLELEADSKEDKPGASPALTPLGPPAGSRLLPGVLIKSIAAPSASQNQNQSQTPNYRQSGMPPAPVPATKLSLAGLLNVLDGVEEIKGVLFVLTTNDPSSLDAALTRPGRVDISIELRKASRQQAEDLFTTFYKPYDDEELDFDVKNLGEWAKTWSKCVGHEEFSIASLQGMLLNYRINPFEAVAAMPEWVREKRFPHLFSPSLPPKTEPQSPLSTDVLEVDPNEVTEVTTCDGGSINADVVDQEDATLESEDDDAALHGDDKEVEHDKAAEDSLASSEYSMMARSRADFA